MKFIKNNIVSICLAALFIAGGCDTRPTTEKTSTNPAEHKVVVKEVLQVTQYTYLLVTENDRDQWIAAPKMEVNVGNTYYYINGMVMTNFTSKDLGRTFDNIIFVDKLSTEPVPVTSQGNAAATPQPGSAGTPAQPATPQKPVIEKAEVKIDKAGGGISIAQLFAKKENYAGKTVKIKGQVTKVNSGIMNKTWVHLQDGTSFENNFDLTVTTQGEFKVGDIVTFEGKISLKKDFGYGYFYEVIMEDGKAI